MVAIEGQGRGTLINPQSRQQTHIGQALLKDPSGRGRTGQNCCVLAGAHRPDVVEEDLGPWALS